MGDPPCGTAATSGSVAGARWAAWSAAARKTAIASPGSDLAPSCKVLRARSKRPHRFLSVRRGPRDPGRRRPRQMVRRTIMALMCHEAPAPGARLVAVILGDPQHVAMEGPRNPVLWQLHGHPPLLEPRQCRDVCHRRVPAVLCCPGSHRPGLSPCCWSTTPESSCPPIPPPCWGVVPEVRPLRAAATWRESGVAHLRVSSLHVPSQSKWCPASCVALGHPAARACPPQKKHPTTNPQNIKSGQISVGEEGGLRPTNEKEKGDTHTHKQKKNAVAGHCKARLKRRFPAP